MNINFHNWRNNEIEQWSIVHAVTESGLVEQIDSDNINIELLVDGVEINFLDFMREMFCATEKNYAEYAMKVLESRLCDLKDAIFDLEEYARYKIDSIVDWES